LEGLESIRAELDNGQFERFDLTSWLASGLERVLAGKRFDAADLGLRGSYIQVTTSVIHHVFESHVDGVRRLPSGELLVEGRSDVACEVELYMIQREFDALSEEDRPRVWSPPDQPDGYGVGYRIVPIQIQFALTVDEKNGAVTSSEVADVKAV